jgi:hypothetical protein
MASARAEAEALGFAAAGAGDPSRHLRDSPDVRSAASVA